MNLISDSKSFISTAHCVFSRNIPYAVRATLVSTEALKSKGMYKDASMQFIKMMSEESDLRSALLLEQAAHCFINMKTPMVRKYSFHMILAGHRFSKAGQVNTVKLIDLFGITKSRCPLEKSLRSGGVVHAKTVISDKVSINNVTFWLEIYMTET